MSSVESNPATSATVLQTTTWLRFPPRETLCACGSPATVGFLRKIGGVPVEAQVWCEAHALVYWDIRPWRRDLSEESVKGLGAPA